MSTEERPLKETTRESEASTKPQSQTKSPPTKASEEHREMHASVDVVPEGLMDQSPDMVTKQLNDLDGFDR